MENTKPINDTISSSNQNKELTKTNKQNPAGKEINTMNRQLIPYGREIKPNDSLTAADIHALQTNIITPLEKQQFKSKLTNQDRMQLRTKLKTTYQKKKIILRITLS